MKSKKANLKKGVKGPMKMKKGGYLEPDKELMFGGPKKYKNGGRKMEGGGDLMDFQKAKDKKRADLKARGYNEAQIDYMMQYGNQSIQSDGLGPVDYVLGAGLGKAAVGAATRAVGKAAAQGAGKAAAQAAPRQLAAPGARMAQGQARAANAAKGAGPSGSPIVTPRPGSNFNVPAVRPKPGAVATTPKKPPFSVIDEPVGSKLDMTRLLRELGPIAGITGAAAIANKVQEENNRPAKATATPAPKGKGSTPTPAPKSSTTSGRANVGRPTQSGSGSAAPAPKSGAGSGSAAPKPPSKGSTSFNQAFAAARKAGQTTFTWNGKSYGTRRADETPEQHKATMMRVANSAAPAPAAKPSEAKASEQAPQRATTLLRNTTPSLIPPSKLRPSISTSRGTSPGGKVTPREFANPNLKTSKVESATMEGANKALKSDKKKSKIKAGGYLEPNKKLMFGGKSKYEAGGMMEECDPGRPCRNARKAGKTARRQERNRRNPNAARRRAANAGNGGGGAGIGGAIKTIAGLGALGFMAKKAKDSM